MNRSVLRTLPTVLVVLLSGVVLSGCPAPVEKGSARPDVETGELGAAQMKDAVARALANHDTLDRTTALVDLMHRLDATNVDGAFAAYEGVARGVDRQDVALLANAWARFDAEGAIDRFLSFPNASAQFQAVADVIFYRARNGAAKEARIFAEKALGGHSNLSAADKATAGEIILDATARGLAAAGQYEDLTKLLETMPSGQPRSFLITKTMLEFGRDEGSARKWADGIPWEAQNQLKRDVLRPTLALMAGYDGRSASEWYDTFKDRLEPGEWLGDIGDAWARTEPVESLEWLLSEPESQPRQYALRTASYVFLLKDGPAGAVWIKSHLDQPDVHKHMLFPLVQYLISVDIHEALPLAQEIEGKGDKISALKQILMIWSRKDYEAVKQYMAEVGVPAEVVEAVNGHNAIRVERRKAKEAAGHAAGQG